MTETADESAGRFREAWRGYDRREVDAFVTAADLKATRLQRDLTRMETLLAEHRDKERSIHNVLVSAETMADQVREKAQQEAQEILRSARAQAEGILHAARQEVDAFREQSEGLKLRRQETAATLEAFIESLTNALESVRAENSADPVARIAPPQAALPPPIPARPDHPQNQPERADAVTSAAPETFRFNPSRAMNLPEFVLPAPADWVRAAAMKSTVEPLAPAPQAPAFRAAPLRQMAVWLAAGVVFVAILLYLWMGGSRQVAVSASRQVAAARPVASGSAVGTVGAVSPSQKPASTDPRPAGEPEEFTIELRSKSPSWVGVTVDGERVGSRLMNTGEQAVLRARDAIIIRVGDAGALSMTINGQPARALGEPGQVVTARIDKTNLKSMMLAK